MKAVIDQFRYLITRYKNKAIGHIAIGRVSIGYTEMKVNPELEQAGTDLIDFATQCEEFLNKLVTIWMPVSGEDLKHTSVALKAMRDVSDLLGRSIYPDRIDRTGVSMARKELADAIYLIEVDKDLIAKKHHDSDRTIDETKEFLLNLWRSEKKRWHPEDIEFAIRTIDRQPGWFIRLINSAMAPRGDRAGDVARLEKELYEVRKQLGEEKEGRTRDLEAIANRIGHYGCVNVLKDLIWEAEDRRLKRLAAKR